MSFILEHSSKMAQYFPPLTCLIHDGPFKGSTSSATNPNDQCFTTSFTMSEVELTTIVVMDSSFSGSTLDWSVV